MFAARRDAASAARPHDYAGSGGRLVDFIVADLMRCGARVSSKQPLRECCSICTAMIMLMFRSAIVMLRTRLASFDPQRRLMLTASARETLRAGY